MASFLRSAASSLPRDLDDVTIPDFSDVSCFALAGGQGRDESCAAAPSACLSFPVVPSFLYTSELILHVVSEVTLRVDSEHVRAAVLLWSVCF